MVFYKGIIQVEQFDENTDSDLELNLEVTSDGNSMN